MRADRLLSLLMLLQSRGRMTAEELAESLEVSERTIYRDIDALSGSGVPVYGERGPEGGYALLDTYRTTLTGLTENQVRALFMLSVPAPLADLGVSLELRDALLKLAASLPVTWRDEAERVRQRVYLDAKWWFHGDEPAPYLQTVYDAVLQDRRLYIRYRQPSIVPLDVERLVDPYGVVAKAGVWYLVCAKNGRVHVYRVADLLGAYMTKEPFPRPAGFDLTAFWQQWCIDEEQNRPTYPVLARIAPHLIPELHKHFGKHIDERIARASPPDAEGWITVELTFDYLWTARERLLSFGGAVQVLEPEALRDTLLDYANQIVARYGR